MDIEWMSSIWNKLGNEKQKDLIITTDLIQNQCRKILDWMKKQMPEWPTDRMAYLWSKDSKRAAWIKTLGQSTASHPTGMYWGNFRNLEERSLLLEEKEGWHRGAGEVKVSCPYTNQC